MFCTIKQQMSVYWFRTTQEGETLTQLKLQLMSFFYPSQHFS